MTTIVPFTQLARNSLLRSCGKRKVWAPLGSNHRLFPSNNKKDESFLEKTQRQFSNNGTTSSPPPPTPLILAWDGEIDNKDKEEKCQKMWRPAILYPFPVNLATDLTIVTYVDEAVEKVDAHYSNEQSFVGGMGESDPGVAVVSKSYDILDFPESIVELIQTVKQARHGVPFHLLTTGIAASGMEEQEEWDLWKSAGVESWKVSLYAGTPDDYSTILGISKSEANHYPVFGQVCNFIVEANDNGMAVEAIVTPSQASKAKDVALSLGAHDIHAAVEPTS